VVFSDRLSRTPSKSVVLTNQSCLGFATGASQLHIIIYRYTYDYYYHYSLLNKYSSRLQAINATRSIQREVFQTDTYNVHAHIIYYYTRMLINLNSNYNKPDRLDTTTAAALTSLPPALVVIIISRSYTICIYSTPPAASKYIIIIIITVIL